MRDGIIIKSALGEKFKNMKLRVGIFNASDIAKYGAAHEFGVPSKNLPRRSFLIEPIKRDFPKLADKAKTLNELGIKLVAACQNEIRTQGHGSWQGFSENYKRRPSGAPITPKSKLLQDTGNLISAITFQAEGA